MTDREIYEDNVVVVLNEPQDRVNIAGTIRAMMNTGLRRLRLVKPAEWDEYRIEGIAHGSEIVRERAEFFDTLEDAIADAVEVVGTTARRRAMPGRSGPMTRIIRTPAARGSATPISTPPRWARSRPARCSRA